VTDESAPAIAATCARLDGLPLAIELAAARFNLLTPNALLARLNQRLDVLVGGPRDRPVRQQTLSGTIQCSFDLLVACEQALAARALGQHRAAEALSAGRALAIEQASAYALDTAAPAAHG